MLATYPITSSAGNCIELGTLMPRLSGDSPQVGRVCLFKCAAERRSSSASRALPQTTDAGDPVGVTHRGDDNCLLAAAAPDRRGAAQAAQQAAREAPSVILTPRTAAGAAEGER